MSESNIVLPGLGTVTMEVKEKTFKTGSKGFYGNHKTELGGKEIRVQILVFVK